MAVYNLTDDSLVFEGTWDECEEWIAGQQCPDVYQCDEYSL
jgi:hypothetical protein